MQINYKYISFYLNDTYFDRTKESVIFLHGFSGSSSDWNKVLPKISSKFSPIAIDLIGHGKTSSPEKESDYSITEIIKQLSFILKYMKIKEPVLAGYSMGGRAALSFTANNVNIPRALILESSTAGIESTSDQIARVEADNNLARDIINFGMDWFTKHWMNIPLFESQKSLSEKILLNIVKEKLTQNPLGLALSLRGFSTGKMPSLWNNLKTIKQKTLLISGELDQKFSEINKKMANYLPNCEHKIIQETGHNTHLEKPEEFTILVNNFLKSLT
ncbi:MAG: 2-succinyl-6-hydroxy-2,4-cyclohexadiene-1-carboxylate synthase [Rhodothermaceae bacterium]